MGVHPCLMDPLWPMICFQSTRSAFPLLSRVSVGLVALSSDRSSEVRSLTSFIVPSSLCLWVFVYSTRLTGFSMMVGGHFAGFIQERVGWRWLGYTTTIFSACCTLVALLIVPETYAPAILRSRARKLAKSIGAHHITSYEAGRVIGGWKEETQKYLVRPFVFLCCEPIVLLLSLHVSFLYGVLSEWTPSPPPPSASPPKKKEGGGGDVLSMLAVGNVTDGWCDGLTILLLILPSSLPV